MPVAPPGRLPADLPQTQIQIVVRLSCNRNHRHWLRRLRLGLIKPQLIDLDRSKLLRIQTRYNQSVVRQLTELPVKQICLVNRDPRYCHRHQDFDSRRFRLRAEAPAETLRLQPLWPDVRKRVVANSVRSAHKVAPQ